MKMSKRSSFSGLSMKEGNRQETMISISGKVVPWSDGAGGLVAGCCLR